MPIRMTADQYRLLLRKRKTDPTEPKQRRLRQRKPKASLPENQLVKQIRDFLAIHGWVTIRQQVGTFVPYRMLVNKQNEEVYPIRIGDKGASDWTAVRPFGNEPGQAQFFTFEAKASGKKPRPDQLLWMERRRVMGFLAEWFDTLDGDSATSFVPWYRKMFGFNVK